MIRPRFFHILSGSYDPCCEAMDGLIPLEGVAPTDRKLQFRIQGTSRRWEDVLPCGGKSIGLFSEKVVAAIIEGKVRGIEFHEAEIVEVGKAILAQEPLPRYYWAKAKGLIVYDWEIMRAGGGYVPKSELGDEESDFFHLSADRGGFRSPRSYVCTLAVVETCRRYGIDNLDIHPIDCALSALQVDPFKPTFRIDLFGSSWPPRWYPEGFEAHPSNQMDDGQLIHHIAPLFVPTPREPHVTRAGGTASRWAGRHPVDDRSVDLTEPQDWRLLRLTEAEVTVLETELRLVIPPFLRLWLIQNPFRDRPAETRALMCHRDRLIYANVELRREGYYGREWPETLLYLGDDWGGGAYFVDTAEDGPSVYYYDWEQSEGDTVLPAYSERYSPEAFIEEIFRMYGY